MKKVIFVTLAAFSATALAQTPNSVYLFNDSLAPSINTNGLASSILFNGGSPSYGTDTINGFSKRYLSVGSTQQLQGPTGLTANGGGSYVNQFTFIEEVKATGAFGIYDSNDANPGNGPEAWVDSKGFLHTGKDGGSYGTVYTSSMAVDFTKWHQYAVAVDTTTTAVQLYVDGNLMLTGITDGVDGKESLYVGPNDYTDFFTTAHLTGVGNNQIAYLYAYGQTLTQDQIRSAVPEPLSMVGLGLGAIALIRKRRR